MLKIDPGDMKMREGKIDLNRNRWYCTAMRDEKPSHGIEGCILWYWERQGFTGDETRLRAREFCGFSVNRWLGRHLWLFWNGILIRRDFFFKKGNLLGRGKNS